MGESWVLSGDPVRLFSTAEELQSVTAEDVRRVARSMLAPSKRTVVIGVPLR
jgi:predicted Zn-dependent peptidase